MTDVFDRLRSALSDRYTIERELGSGGMATVYLAEDLKHHRIEIAAKLTHPHILPLHDSGVVGSYSVSTDHIRLLD